MSTLTIKTPRWALPLQDYKRYKFISGGRSSGKSHERVETAIENMMANPHWKIVCLREIQKSLKFSAYQLFKDKIISMGVSHYFDIVQNEIRRVGGEGIAIFQGMQDHTADSIKSLEGFDCAWFEEAQNCSHKSLKLLRPTIRKEGSEIWFTWNPDQPDDPVDTFSKEMDGHKSAIHIHVNYDQNPFLPATAYNEMLLDREKYPDDFDHIWLGGYNVRSDIRVFNNWCIEYCEPSESDHLYYGADWGFANDPSVLMRAWVREKEKEIYVDYDINGIGIETDHLPRFFDGVPLSRVHTITADSSRPETISYMNRNGFRVAPSIKGKGSVEDGINWLRGYKIIVHPRCEMAQKELRLYSYQTDRAGNIQPKVEDDNNHFIDALRYALEKLIRSNKSYFMS